MLFRISFFIISLMVTSSAYAVDSYRYAHVTIETPWAIFIFLLLIILVPFVLMAILHWYFAGKDPAAEQNDHE
ncbi:MAG: hypothetical protein COB30_014200 [Ectothiorhodospiraceae bacterium]|nr:hypothetical protein [Ectothiorhodospiraceae bacterium]